MTYATLTNGHHGTVSRWGRGGRTHALIRKASGSYEMGRVQRVWKDEAAAMRDRFRPAIRKAVTR